jgi:hypothetical protein
VKTWYSSVYTNKAMEIVYYRRIYRVNKKLKTELPGHSNKKPVE